MAYKSFSVTPRSAKNLKGEEVDLSKVVSLLIKDIRTLSELVEYQIHADSLNIRNEVKNLRDEKPTLKASKVGELLEYKLPKESFASGKSGRSRFQRMFQSLLIREVSSWIARSDVANGVLDSRVSAGWKRTADNMIPSDLNLIMPLSAADDSYVKFLNNPLVDGLIELKLVVDGNWHVLEFAFDKKRFAGAKKVCLPNVRVKNDNSVVFDFSVEYENQYPLISSSYVIGVDVGVVQPATCSVVDTSSGEIVYSTTLSRRVHGLANSINKSEKQKNQLRKLGRDEEAALHRQAASRKKRELALLIGQEIAEISVAYENALVAVEDLSWVENTMANGRWNRGEVVKWINHYVELNGGRVYKVNPFNTSKNCHLCHEKGELLMAERLFLCTNRECLNIGVLIDRDVNAGGEIAHRVIGNRLTKTVATRKSSSKRHNFPKQKIRSPKTRESLKYPGRDRTKNAATPKRVKRKKNPLPRKIEEVLVENKSTAGAIGRIVSADVARIKNDKDCFSCTETVECCLNFRSHRSHKRIIKKTFVAKVGSF